MQNRSRILVTNRLEHDTTSHHILKMNPTMLVVRRKIFALPWLWSSIEWSNWWVVIVRSHTFIRFLSIVLCSSLLNDAYKAQTELEVQLNVTKSNLQLVIANLDSMLGGCPEETGLWSIQRCWLASYHRAGRRTSIPTDIAWPAHSEGVLSFAEKED